MKICSRCNIEKAPTDFGKKRDGSNTICKPCVRAYGRAWYSDPDNKKAHKARVSKINAIRRSEFKEKVDGLKNVPCADCGGKFNPWQMDFDHVKEGKIKNVSNMGTDRLDLVLKEIAKCEVVCANCHRNRTYARLVQR